MDALAPVAPRASTGTAVSADLERLVRQRNHPSVSLLVALDPGRGPWQARLSALQREAEARLDLEPGGDGLDRVRSALRTAVESVEPARTAKALAVYASVDTATALSLPVDVRDRAVVDETFATRDLVHALNRSPGWWLLALDLRRPRLLHGSGAHLQAVTFDVDEGGAATQPSRQVRDRVEDRRVRRLRRLRAIDAALAVAVPDRSTPLVVVGAEPSVSQFAALAGARRLAVVRGSPRAHPSDLLRVASAELDRLDADRCADALALLDRHVASGRCAAGIDAAWAHAHVSGGAVVLVEAGFEHPVRVAQDGTLTPATDRDAPDVVDDVVDELIEAVLARGGTSQALPDGSLAALGRVALLTRHPVEDR